MRLIYLIIIVLFVQSFLYSQTDKLAEFVDSQQAKLIYDYTKLQKVPNLNVFVIPPEYFQEDPSINGYVHPGSATTIQILEVEGYSYKDIEKGMTPEYIASQGYTYLGKQEFSTADNVPGIIYFVQFESNNIEYERCMFFTGNSKTIWVNVNYPVSMKKLLLPQIEAFLYSVTESANTNEINTIQR
ncbi:MAG TPA: hypothetical protein P5538_04455 [Bacteroidales bacterium]|nr:hypothetical protein [Bacteroidales bacterium]HOL98066.1 hypothetical protein [Bacteroidales bacterium]HOM37231.1 hypothetical protein [Bacteroidales bacterium]HPD23652.1 hypothetical protein [Bacteroidales bacterium]HRS99673.1 hypothetical protein [Bacteroidales bacterium]